MAIKLVVDCAERLRNLEYDSRERFNFSDSRFFMTNRESLELNDNKRRIERVNRNVDH